MKKLVLVGSLLLVVAGLFSVRFLPPKVIPATTESLDVTGLWQDSNNERTKAGLSPLILSTQLDVSAQNKCMDMEQKNYWAHNAPDGTEPWSFIHQQTDFKKAGENLEYGNSTSSAVTTDWMNSSGHKANILDPEFTSVGYAICDFRGTKLVVQHLAS